MPPDASEGNGMAYLAACSRVLNEVVNLVQDRGIQVGVDIDPGQAAPKRWLLRTRSSSRTGVARASWHS